MMNEPSKLDKTASVAMIVASVVLVAVALRGRSSGVIDVELKPYQAGDSLVEIPALSSFKQERFLIVWISSTCRFCTESMPFYERLIAQPHVPVVVMGREPVEVLRRYIAEHRISADNVLSIPSGIRLYQTPSLLQMDLGLKVARIWIGKITDETENEVLVVARSSEGR